MFTEDESQYDTNTISWALTFAFFRLFFLDSLFIHGSLKSIIDTPFVLEVLVSILLPILGNHHTLIHVRLHLVLHVYLRSLARLIHTTRHSLSILNLLDCLTSLIRIDYGLGRSLTSLHLESIGLIIISMLSFQLIHRKLNRLILWKGSWANFDNASIQPNFSELGCLVRIFII